MPHFGEAEIVAQLAFEPPLLPEQLHVHGPVPDTAEAVPDEHKLDVGLTVAAEPLADPHAPLVFSGAEHESVVPPFVPVQLHVHPPVPETVVAVPELHKFVVGLVVTPTPSAEPQEPLVFFIALHEAVVPPFVPTQVQFHGPVPVTAEAVPTEHSPVVGAEVYATPLAAPQAPLPFSGAEHERLVPPAEQVHDHGPVPETVDSSPASHKFVVGMLSAATPLAVPHFG